MMGSGHLNPGDSLAAVCAGPLLVAFEALEFHGEAAPPNGHLATARAIGVLALMPGHVSWSRSTLMNISHRTERVS